MSYKSCVNQSVYKGIKKNNDGESKFNIEAENLMIEHFNFTMDKLHHKIP